MPSGAPKAPQAPNDAELVGRNRFLRALPSQSYQRLMDELEPLDMPARQILWDPNTRIRSVYFRERVSSRFWWCFRKMSRWKQRRLETKAWSAYQS